MIGKRILFILFLSLFVSNAVYSQLTKIEVTAEFDFQQAVVFAMQQNVDTLLLTTSGGVYTTTDTNYFNIQKPLSIVAAPGLAEMPIITHSDPDSSILEMFRVSDDLYVEGVIFDGGHAQSHGMKYALRGGPWYEEGPAAKTGFDIIVKNCVFRDLYEDKDLNKAGHAIYFLRDVVGGTVKVENSTFVNIGDEAMRMAETEKFATERVLDSLIVRNCTFNNIDAECVRFYADTDTSTTDAVVILENLTIDNSATRVMYIKNNQFAVARNIIISNSRLPAPDRADRGDYLMQLQQRGSYIANVDTFNIVYGFPNPPAISATKGAIGLIEGTVFNFDPMYADAANLDYTLSEDSPAYYSGENNTHLGSLTWATNTPTRLPLNTTTEGGGTFTFSPERKGLTFPAGTSVTVTAVADSGYEFVEWGGDLSGANNPETITVDAFKNVSATFSPVTGVEDELIVEKYSLSQNYPNPFNPSTAIKFTVKESGKTSLKIYDLLGQEIKTLFNKNLEAGTHTYFFNASELAAGVYLYQLVSGEYSSTKKMTLLK
ncbi:MAG: T9SS type A sorting domain-containing protein [Melioribacteraceae bacterium]|nr:T9SS type A sorting domain-containing protein [Melioribacteraceae bacterium]MCF8264850.1 T9SS type A sorting domain-containing protein [Melioribacteraceae bacterium]MCF8431570.1 T9SS type A sorting domain-containing protein [Melioribacteraceae bacterium]